MVSPFCHILNKPENDTYLRDRDIFVWFMFLTETLFTSTSFVFS